VLFRKSTTQPRKTLLIWIILTYKISVKTRYCTEKPQKQVLSVWYGSIECYSKRHHSQKFHIIWRQQVFVNNIMQQHLVQYCTCNCRNAFTDQFLSSYRPAITQKLVCRSTVNYMQYTVCSQKKTKPSAFSIASSDCNWMRKFLAQRFKRQLRVWLWQYLPPHLHNAHTW